MFFGFFFILMSGYPVAFSFAGTAIMFGLIGWLIGAAAATGVVAATAIVMGMLSLPVMLRCGYDK